MTLGELMMNYREEHDISQRQFAADCELSHGYISMLEKNKHPKTGKPLTPTLDIYKKVANGMHMSLMELFDVMDDMPVSLKKEAHDSEIETRALNDTEKAIMDILVNLKPEKQNEALRYIRFLSQED